MRQRLVVEYSRLAKILQVIDILFDVFQIPSASGPSTRVDTDNVPEVPSPEDVIRLLRRELEKTSQRVKNLEAGLKGSQSQIQTLNDHEEFLIAELAAQVHDLDYKLPANFSISLLPSSC